MTILDRIMGRTARKAVTGPGVVAYQNGTLLSVMASTPQQKAEAFLKAYKVGWFYKAESKISADIGSLDWTLAYEGGAGDVLVDSERVAVDKPDEDIPTPSSSIPFDSLSPEEQLLRLLEMPNPGQTGSQLVAKTQIRLDMAGSAFLYLEGGAGGGLPTAIYGISPSRMWPSTAPGGELIGWVMDKGRGHDGIPFERDEIVPICYPSADDDWFGQGVVEAVYAEMPLAEMMSRHIGDVLSTGGRLAGMAWPKTRTLDEGEFVQAQRAWRNVTSDPNAARRLLLFPEPMEYATGASSPMEIGIPDLSMLNRDNILTAFPINPAMIGVPMPKGMNSGDAQRWIRKEYWEGTIHPRVEILEEALQQHLVPRYEDAIGRPLDLDIEEPNLDDAPALLEKAAAMAALVALGFDQAETVRAVGLDAIAWTVVAPAAPAAQDAAAMADMAPADTAPPAPTVPDGHIAVVSHTRRRPLFTAKAQRRADITDAEEARFRVAMRTALREQRDRIIPRIETMYAVPKAQRKAIPDSWWDQQAENAWLANRLRGIYSTLSRSALHVVAGEMDRIVTAQAIARIFEKVLAAIGDRIDGINTVTHAAIQAAIDEGIRRGYSIVQLVDGVPDESFAGLTDLPEFDDARAELIARTETMLTYNESALRGYGEYGVTEVTAIDGDTFDAECAARDGQTFAIEEALNIDDHPNGTLDWAPVVTDEGKSYHEKSAPVSVNVEAYQPPVGLTLVRDDAGRIVSILPVA